MILSQNHSEWMFFCQAMQKLDPDALCEHNYNHTKHCLEIIQKIGVEKTIESFAKIGGGCDCEVVMNVVLPSLDACVELCPFETKINATVLYCPLCDTSPHITGTIFGKSVAGSSSGSGLIIEAECESGHKLQISFSDHSGSVWITLKELGVKNG